MTLLKMKIIKVTKKTENKTMTEITTMMMMKMIMTRKMIREVILEKSNLINIKDMIMMMTLTNSTIINLNLKEIKSKQNLTMKVSSQILKEIDFFFIFFNR